MTPDQLRELIEKGRYVERRVARNRIYELAPLLLELWEATKGLGNLTPRQIAALHALKEA